MTVTSALISVCLVRVVSVLVPLLLLSVYILKFLYSLHCLASDGFHVVIVGSSAVALVFHTEPKPSAKPCL